MPSNKSTRRATGSFLVICGLGFALACGGGSSTPPQKIITSGSNVQPVAMNSGITGNYANGLFTSVTVCLPGTTTCQTIDNVLVDTGSIGLRLFASGTPGGQFNLTLPIENDSGNNPIGECTQFIDGSFIWGPIRTADVKLSGEVASSIPINILGDPALSTIPSTCSNGGFNANSAQSFGANGVLGLNVFPQDCGSFCISGIMPPTGIYYSCPNTGCVSAFVPLTQQVLNPISAFATDDNGYIVQLPSISASGQASATGSIVFGIGTQTNNTMSGATVIPLDGQALFTTAYNNHTYMDGSFVDTGSNGLFFLDSTTTGFPTCGDAPGFYCPSSTQNLNATIESAVSSASKGISFSVANADSLFANTSAFVYGNLAGPNSGSFDWGLPFYFGRNVYQVIEGKSTSSGPGPYIAF